MNNNDSLEVILATNTANMIGSLNLQVARLQVQIKQLQAQNQELKTKNKMLEESKKRPAKK